MQARFSIDLGAGDALMPKDLLDVIQGVLAV